MKRKRTTVKYNSGLTLIHKFNNRQKSVYFEFRFKSGLWNDPMDKLGLAHFMEHAIGFSNDQYTKEEKNDFRKRLYYSNFTTTGEYIVVYAYISDEEFEEAFEKHCNYLSSFNINDEEFENERKVIEQEIKRRRVDLSGEMFYLVRSSMFKKLEPYKYVTPSGKVETLANITKQDVQDYTKKVFALNNCQITVYGDVSLRKTKQLIKRYVLPNFEKHTDKKFLNYYDLADKITKPNMYIASSPDGARSKVKCSFVWASPEFDRLNYYALNLLGYVYTSVGRRYFRDKYGLTYNALINFRANKNPLTNKLTLYSNTELDCDQSNVKKALEVLPEFFSFLKEFPITDEIIKEARISFRRYDKATPIRDYVKKGTAMADQYFDYGYFYTKKQNRKYDKLCKKMKADYVKTVQKQLFSGKPYIYVVSNTTDELPKYADLCKQIKKNTKWMAEI